MGEADEPAKQHYLYNFDGTLFYGTGRQLIKLIHQSNQKQFVHSVVTFGDQEHVKM